MSKIYDFYGVAPILYKSGSAGFVTEENRRAPEEERLRIPELSSAFLPHFWLAETNYTKLRSDSRGVYIDSEADSAALGFADASIPLLFRADISGAGNYRVTVTIDNTDGEDDDIILYVTRRRLYYRGKLHAGEVFSQSFHVNACEFIPRGYKEEFEAASIDIAVVGKRPRLSSVEIEKLDETAIPTVWIAGDSTLTDQSAAYPYCPSTSYSGWGQMISAFLDNGVAVSNHAHSGLTTHTFRAGGHHKIVERHIRSGDYFLIQFGHNDQKVDFLSADGGYRDRIIGYCNEVRAVGAYPVIVTPLARNSWRGDGGYNDLLYAYDAACKRVGEELGVPVIGLHDFMMEKVTSEGLEAAKRYYYPGDYTHTNDPGAYMCAEYIANELSLLSGDYAYLASLVKRNMPEWAAPHGAVPPVPPTDYKAAEAVTAAKPTDGELTRAEAADMIIKSAHYFIVNVYNDMYDDVVGHEWYAGAVECAYQNGILPSELTAGKKFRPDEKITLGDFIVMATCAYASRNTPPEEMPCPLDGECEEWHRVYVRRAYALGLIGEGDGLSESVGKLRANDICRKMKL